MPIELADIERGEPFAGDYQAALTALQERLARAQRAQIGHRRRVAIVLEGPEGAGKKSALKCLAAALDPCHFTTICTAPDRRQSAEGHWLARFWSRLPAAGHTAIFFHSWYRRVLEDHVMRLVGDKDWRRGFDEINEFEAQQRDYGTLLIKLYFHATDKVLDERIAARAADPWQQAQLGPVALRSVEGREALRAALALMFKQTDTRWAPWHAIDAGNQAAAELAALTVIAEMLEQAMPAEPTQRAETAAFTPALGRLSPA